MRGWDVYAKSGFLLLCASLTTAGIDRSLAVLVKDSTLRLAIAFSLIQVTAGTAMAAYLLAQRWYTRFQKNIGDQLRPAIQEHVTAVAFAGQPWPAAVPKRGPARHVLEECVATSLLGLRDSGRDRLVHFVWHQGFVKQWQQAFSSRSVKDRKQAIALLGLVSRAESEDLMRRALHDNEPAIRTEAARALLAGGDPVTTDMVFRAVLGESLLVRVLLAADLRRHARSLLADTIPALLAGGMNSKVLRCLQILTVWKLALPDFDIEPLLERHRNQPTLPLVISLLPYVSTGAAIEEYLASALETADIEVQCAAARAVGQLKLASLTPSLLRLLSQSRRLAVASAIALTQLETEGEQVLCTVVAGPDRSASAAALEALETLAVGVQ